MSGGTVFEPKLWEASMKIVVGRGVPQGYAPVTVALTFSTETEFQAFRDVVGCTHTISEAANSAQMMMGGPAIPIAVASRLFEEIHRALP